MSVKTAFEKNNFSHTAVFGDLLSAEFTVEEAAEYLEFSSSVRNGLRVSWNTVPAVSDVLPSHALHRNTPRAVTQCSPATPQGSQTNPFGQHKRRI